MEIPVLPILFVATTFFSTLAGGLFVLKNKKLQIKYLFAFAAGALIGIVFFDLFPEEINLISTLGINTTLITGTIVASFFLFHILDRFFVIHSMKEHRPDKSPNSALQMNGMVRAAGLSIHSFLDGVAIGTAFHLGAELGLIIGLAVILHDFSDGLNTVTVLRRAGSTHKISLSWLLLDSIAPVLGAIATFVLVISESTLAILLAVFIGEFLFIGMADLLPEAHSKGTSYKVVLASVIGVLLVFLATRFLNL